MLKNLDTFRFTKTTNILLPSTRVFGKFIIRVTVINLLLTFRIIS